MDLNSVFEDPDTETAVRMDTVEGPIDIALWDDANSPDGKEFFELCGSRRLGSLPSFIEWFRGIVIQGGGFRLDPDDVIAWIKEDPPVKNEFHASRSNLRGTIAMAKISGNPDSASSQWFFNLEKNSERFDGQNGGFTTFGRVMGSTHSTIDTFANYQIETFIAPNVRTCTGDPPNESCSVAADTVLL